MQAPCFWSLKTNNESSYLIGRRETIKKIQQSKNGIISSCKILDCENWTPSINQSFIHALYADLQKNEPIYMCTFSDLDKEFLTNTGNCSIFAIELNCILKHFENPDGDIICITSDGIHDGIHLYKIQKVDGNVCGDNSITKSIKDILQSINPPNSCLKLYGGGKIKLFGRIRNQYMINIDKRKMILVKYKGEFVNKNTLSYLEKMAS